MTTETKRHYPIRRAKRTEDDQDSRSSSRQHSPGQRNAGQRDDEARAPRRERRALSHVGGEVQFQDGSDEEQSVLLSALDVTADEDQVMADVHGFHSYPARLHPATARGLIEGFSRPGARVLDPFSGSGTVVVEARALGREAIGSDLNPLAVELSWLKSRGPTQKLVDEMLRAAATIAEVAEERRVAKADPYLRYGEEDRERYPVHTLLELDSLAHGISLVAKNEIVRMLRLVVSSMLTKLSHSEGDTTRRRAPRRLPGGYAIQLFTQKAEELARRLNAYRERLPEKAPAAYVGCNDARELSKIDSDSIDLIITSPPYPGVYDYLDHHLHRIRWLGLREGGLRRGEIGSRREYRRLRVDDAARLWQDEIGAVLYELRRTLAQDGRGIMVIADSVIDRRPLRADEQVRAVAKRAGIDITCIASQERPLFLHGADQAFQDRPRMEHVVVFRPGERPHRADRWDRSLKQELAELRDRERPERFNRGPAAEAARDEDEDNEGYERPRPFKERDDRGPRRFNDDRPRRSFGDRDDRGPRRSFGDRDDRGPRFDSRGGDDRPRRSFGDRDDRGPRRFNDDRPRRFNDDRGERPQRSFADRDDRPRRSFGDRDDRGPRRFNDDRPRRFNDDRGERPQRSFGDRDDRGPRRFNDDRDNRGPRSDSRDRDERGPRRFNDDRPRRFNDDRGDRPQRSFGDRDNRGPRSDARDRDDRPRRSFGDRDDRGPRRSFGDRNDRRGQRPSQDRTWDSKPRGPGRPRSNSGPKPK